MFCVEPGGADLSAAPHVCSANAECRVYIAAGLFYSSGGICQIDLKSKLRLLPGARLLTVTDLSC